MDGVFYLAACGEISEGGGIFRYRLNAKGAPELLGCNPINNPNWMSFSPDRKYLYSTCSIGYSFGVAAYKVNPDSSLTEINKAKTGGLAGCYVITDPSGKFLFCANYSSGTVSVFALDGNGGIGELLRTVRHSGKGPEQPRQDGPHTHYTNITPDGKYLIVIDLGIDAVRLYPFDPVKGIDEDKAYTFQVEPAGSGPRHLVFEHSGRFAYLLDELGNTVHVLAYENGTFRKIGLHSTLPAGFEGITKAAAIRLSQDERFLFASNRGYDSIAVFALDGQGGMKMADLVLTGGSSPRDINFLPGWKKFAAANEFSDTVYFYDYDAAAGKLTPDGHVLHHKRPLAICW